MLHGQAEGQRYLTPVPALGPQMMAVNSSSPTAACSGQWEARGLEEPMPATNGSAESLYVQGAAGAAPGPALPWPCPALPKPCFLGSGLIRAELCKGPSPGQTGCAPPSAAPLPHAHTHGKALGPDHVFSPHLRPGMELFEEALQKWEQALSVGQCGDSGGTPTHGDSLRHPETTSEALSEVGTSPRSPTSQSCAGLVSRGRAVILRPGRAV